MTRRTAVAVATALATGALAVASGCGGDEPNPAITPDPAFGAQPNIVFIYTDDQDYSSFNRRVMPHTFADIVDHGSDFKNYYDATPLCCPARAGVLTGQYGHNNGVLSNKPGYGDLADNENTLPVWLQRAGYRTAIAGKYLNGYENAVDDKDDVAPGWDLWSVEIGNGRGYYDFKLAVNGHQRKEIYKGQYLTNVINGRAVEDVHQLSGDRPFFLWVTQSAPHVENINANSGGPCGGEAVPPSRDLGRFAGTQLPRLPGVLEQDVSDKPEIVSGQPRISPKQRRVIRHRYECRIETLPAVDRGVAQIVDALRQTGELDDTILVFSLRQRHLPGPAPDPRGQGPRLRGGRAPAARRPGAAEVRGRAHAAGDDQRDDREHRLRADVHRLGRLAELPRGRRLPGHGRALVAAAVRPKGGLVPSRPPAGDRAPPEQRARCSPGAGSPVRTRACATAATCSSGTRRFPTSRRGSASRPTCASSTTT